ncbi:MAG: AAA family ATPase [Phycisphaerales bacterium]|nr:MAG: AAA family ATPase [Phycisphaerales bacterium]
MSNMLQVCLYNADPASSAEIRQHLEALNFVRFACEVSNSDDLADVLSDSDTSLIFFHLDPDPAYVIDVIDQVSSRFPELAMIALSHETGPEAILSPIRAGCDQYVCEPIDPTDLAAAVGRVASKRLLSQGTSRSICVVGAGGGSGATSIACNLAMEIAHLTDKPCGLVDLDLQFGDIAVNFDCDPKYTLFDLATAGNDLDRTMMEGVLTEIPGNVALLARPDKIDQTTSVTHEVVHRAVELLASVFENVVIDMPQRIDECTFAAASQADLVLVVCQLMVPSIRNAKRHCDVLVQAGIPDERLEVVVNRGDSSGGRITVKDLEELIKKPIFASVPNDFQFVARSLDFGRPIATLDHNNAVRSAIRKMARKIVSGPGADAKDKGGRRGFLGRLLSKG